MATDKRSGRLAQAAVLASIMSLGAGCASTPEMNSMRAEVEEAKQAAAEARAAAEEAQSSAKKAQAAADEALRKAEAAEQCCRDTNEKIDRMFKRSMYK